MPGPPGQPEGLLPRVLVGSRGRWLPSQMLRLIPIHLPPSAPAPHPSCADHRDQSGQALLHPGLSAAYKPNENMARRRRSAAAPAAEAAAPAAAHAQPAHLRDDALRPASSVECTTFTEPASHRTAASVDQNASARECNKSALSCQCRKPPNFISTAIHKLLIHSHLPPRI
jgi:hypothetical protein